MNDILLRDPALPTIEDVRRAAERLLGHTVRTPLLSSRLLDERVAGRVLLKCENLQRTGSFKFRGAYNALAALSRETRSRGVVAISSGNHAQGVAEAARLFGVRATIVMPADAPATKRARTERSGGRVISYDRASDNREAIAAKIIGSEGGTLIHPYNDADVIAGQGTIGLEIVEDCRAADVRPDQVVAPCGGGGLSSGAGLAVKASLPETEMVLVEPQGFDEYGRSLAAGKAIANTSVGGSVCDALMATAPGALGFSINRENHARGVAVSDEEALAAVAFAFRELKLVLEPGGAVALAALLSGRLDGRGKVTVAVLSGGNIDEPMLARALAEAVA